MSSKLTMIIREKENTRNQSYQPTRCFNCGRQEHRAHECPEPRRMPPQPYTVNHSKKDELSKEPTGRIVNQPRQTKQVQLKQQEERTQSTQSAEMKIMTEPAKENAKNAMPRVKCQRGLSVVDQHLAQVLKQPIITPMEVDYVEDQPQRISAARCNVKIRNKPVIAVLNSGAAISEPSNTVVVTMNRIRERALGKLKDVVLQLGRITVPTDFQVIESMEEMMLLGMSWFKRLCTRLYFDEQKLIITHEGESIELPIHQEKKAKIEKLKEEEEENYKKNDYFDIYKEEELDEVESYLTDDQENLYTNPWIDEYSPAAYLTVIEEALTAEETE
ncbi:5013_t:CDS:2 [Acaulospora morrowiae]|uniref:5013_t:CDS:1 n=1 Tax=Acaulospora morrowiae TaxID=94023 RepID=A0A9N9FKU0_9GLOM|nr:5013_t:CDS:2 [Acaulospora morrowiae]